MSYTLPQKRAIIKAAEQHVRGLLEADSTGHDWHHIQRVRRTAANIAKQEKADAFLVDMMVLFHEIADFKIVGEGNEDKALRAASMWLAKQGLEQADVQHIIYVVANQSFSISGVKGFTLKTKEGRVVQDADRLDALGAIGIARCFAYGGSRGRALHDPDKRPRQITSTKQYRNSETTFNHFYEKILKLKYLMNTAAGKALARERHRFVQAYMKQFLAEWDGKR
jgi:uncharacterized protein